MSAAAALPDRLGGAPDGKRSLRLWLRLLTCATTIERTIAQRLRDEFGSTLPRFDMLSALDRAGEAGLTMGAVSRMLMVSNGNVTGLAARLKADGLIEAMSGTDRRVQRVRLTPPGRARFAAMAIAHERWIEALFADLTEAEAEALTRLLERTKGSLHATTPEELNG
ncbi:MAG: MarR family transcriptional regulator [Brevundimonas sp.]|uniref:MarR family winged helix-turn-helix transcriptional regulator n=1 Tax=Brevundimonas sp. TaxID=1871086 RepID=UPI00272653A7|nr:MarR family transcriptional regulator [Brevundimonas sp.]MDO9587696.1 MarR family transcriptional regulator [Brevundimonas sp.]MDP3370416.1 MarR family transcriptional regulator [Brevundimonas sp.]MDP3656655.1 MarR family transcriptional regulator [Brevundimonas sp.]MDZ4113181.1 MarR family transcriptional regulator [Brevundimonas sp.]